MMSRLWFSSRSRRGRYFACDARVCVLLIGVVIVIVGVVGVVGRSGECV